MEGIKIDLKLRIEQLKMYLNIIDGVEEDLIIDDMFKARIIFNFSYLGLIEGFEIQSLDYNQPLADFLNNRRGEIGRTILNLNTQLNSLLVTN